MKKFPSNQLAEWNHIDQTDSTYADNMNDYFNCLIECEDDQPSCKRICREVLF